MRKADKIKMYKNLRDTAKSLMEVAKQNYETAARLESEAKSALAELGVQQEQPSKGKLSEAQTINLLSRLTQ